MTLAAAYIEANEGAFADDEVTWMNSITIFQLGCALRPPLELAGIDRNLIRFDAKGKGWQKLARWAGLVKKYQRLAEVVHVKTSLSDWKACSSFLLTCLANTQVGTFCSFVPQAHCPTFPRIETLLKWPREFKVSSMFSTRRGEPDR